MTKKKVKNITRKILIYLVTIELIIFFIIIIYTHEVSIKLEL